MGQRAYCDQPHAPRDDEGADWWCEMYHRVRLPGGEPCALDRPMTREARVS